MGYLLPALTEAKFSNQRDVVLNERRQNYENRPYGSRRWRCCGAVPADHPYHWTTIGEIADLQAVQLDEVHAFFRRYYHPANASIALAGDIDPDERWRWSTLLRRASSRRARRAGRAGVAAARRRIQFEDRVELPRLYSPGSRRRCSPRRRRSRSGDRPARQRQDVAAVSPAGVRRAHRDRRVGLAELARDGGYAQITRRRRPGTRSPSSSGDLEEIARLAATARPTTRSSAAASRRKRSSCSGCRRSAASAASPIS
jgi:hypothetical protein